MNEPVEEPALIDRIQVPDAAEDLDELAKEKLKLKEIEKELSTEEAVKKITTKVPTKARAKKIKIKQASTDEKSQTKETEKNLKNVLISKRMSIDDQKLASIVAPAILPLDEHKIQEEVPVEQPIAVEEPVKEELPPQDNVQEPVKVMVTKKKKTQPSVPKTQETTPESKETEPTAVSTSEKIVRPKKPKRSKSTPATVAEITQVNEINDNQTPVVEETPLIDSQHAENQPIENPIIENQPIVNPIIENQPIVNQQTDIELKKKKVTKKKEKKRAASTPPPTSEETPNESPTRTEMEPTVSPGDALIDQPVKKLKKKKVKTTPVILITKPEPEEAAEAAADNLIENEFEKFIDSNFVIPPSDLNTISIVEPSRNQEMSVEKPQKKLKKAKKLVIKEVGELNESVDFIKSNPVLPASKPEASQEPEVTNTKSKLTKKPQESKANEFLQSTVPSSELETPNATPPKTKLKRKVKIGPSPVENVAEPVEPSKAPLKSFLVETANSQPPFNMTLKANKSIISLADSLSSAEAGQFSEKETNTDTKLLDDVNYTTSVVFFSNSLIKPRSKPAGLVDSTLEFMPSYMKPTESTKRAINSAPHPKKSEFHEESIVHEQYDSTSTPMLAVGKHYTESCINEVAPKTRSSHPLISSQIDKRIIVSVLKPKEASPAAAHKEKRSLSTHQNLLKPEEVAHNLASTKHSPLNRPKQRSSSNNQIMENIHVHEVNETIAKFPGKSKKMPTFNFTSLATPTTETRHEQTKLKTSSGNSIGSTSSQHGSKPTMPKLPTPSNSFNLAEASLLSLKYSPRDQDYAEKVTQFPSSILKAKRFPHKIKPIEFVVRAEPEPVHLINLEESFLLTDRAGRPGKSVLIAEHENEVIDFTESFVLTGRNHTEDKGMLPFKRPVEEKPKTTMKKSKYSSLSDLQATDNPMETFNELATQKLLDKATAFPSSILPIKKTKRIRKSHSVEAEEAKPNNSEETGEQKSFPDAILKKKKAKKAKRSTNEDEQIEEKPAGTSEATSLSKINEQENALLALKLLSSREDDHLISKTTQFPSSILPVNRLNKKKINKPSDATESSHPVNNDEKSPDVSELA